MSKIENMVDEAVTIAEDDSHGYDQSDRWGPNFDCSSLMYQCAHDAGYAVPIGRGYTGSMLSDFTGAGFNAVPFDGNLNDLDPGDIMLNCADHTEMYIGNGQFVGAHIDENGNVAGGMSGDQTGCEISVCDAYVFSNGWDYVLCPPKDGEDTPPTNTDAVEFWYSAHTAEDGWLPEVHSLDDYAGVAGHSIDALCIRTNDGHHLDYAIHHKDGNDWGSTISSDNADQNNYDTGYAGTFNNFPDAVRCYLNNDCKSGERAKFRVRVLDGDWQSWQYDDEQTETQDGYAGEFGLMFDGFQIC